MSRVRLVAALTALAVLALTANALGSILRGGGRDDPQMPVKLIVSATEVTFSYSAVRVDCSDGSRVRQGGAIHAAHINERGRFRDRLEVEGATSVVRGRLVGRRASGSLTYDLIYAGGECHSGKVPWKAKQK